jgi:hypothetical protein
MHPKRKVLPASLPLHLRMKEDPGTFSGKKRNIRKDIHKARSVGIPFGILLGKSGKALEFLIQKGHGTARIHRHSHFRKNRPQHGKKKIGEHLFPERVITSVL